MPATYDAEGFERAREAAIAENSVERRLAAVLSADVVGYSRLMEADETGTLDRLEAHRREVIDPSIAKNNGRIVKLMGDGALVEFASVVDAVQCAAEIQREMAARNRDEPEGRRIAFRIGVNLGDIIVRGDDIYGDGVNVAARLQELADPGGLIISGTAFDHARNKVEVGLEDLGAKEVKNITEPVRAYRVLLEPEASGTLIAHKQAKARLAPAHWAGIGLAAAIAIAALVWAVVEEPWVVRVEPADPAKMAFALPDKPSIAVLPFDNMSDEPGQEWFADGMTDDLITNLSQVSGLFVIARNSTFTYKGKPVKVQRVAEELGVRYVLEGSVRRAGDQVRINVQLVDAVTGRHLWADRFDGSVADVFALQDKVTRKIVTALSLKLAVAEEEHLARPDTDNADAYDSFLQGWELYRRDSADDFAKAVPHFERDL